MANMNDTGANAQGNNAGSKENQNQNAVRNIDGSHGANNQTPGSGTAGRKHSDVGSAGGTQDTRKPDIRQADSGRSTGKQMLGERGNNLSPEPGIGSEIEEEDADDSEVREQNTER
jgi:hypothetical protein